MDQTGSALIDAISPYGPGWLVAMVFVLAIIYLVAKLVPTVQNVLESRVDIERKTAEANIKLEAMKEQRAAEESRAIQQRNIERGETEGRWVQAMEHSVNVQNATNTIIEGVRSSIDGFDNTSKALKVSIDSLIVSIETSRQKNTELSSKVDYIYDWVTGLRREDLE